MRKLILISALIFAGPAFATELTADTYLGTTMQQVQEQLTQMGYQVRKAEMEDGRIEVYFVKGDKMGEVYVDAATGKISQLKIK